MKFLIIGRTASGKDTLKSILTERYGWRFVKSCTTRPKRSADEDTHVFITAEEAEDVPASDKAAQTIINGYEYFATIEQVEESDGYIIDPIGARELLSKMPDTNFYIVYLVPEDSIQQEEAAISRAEDGLLERAVFKKRRDAEDAQFSAFETAIANGMVGNVPNVISTLLVRNDYNRKTLSTVAEKLNIVKADM